MTVRIKSEFQNVWLYLATSQIRPRLVITFLRSHTTPRAPSTLTALGCPLPLHVRPLIQWPAASSLNLRGWLSACLVTEDQRWSGKTSPFLCHPVGCIYCFNRVWTQIWGPLFQVCRFLDTVPQLRGTLLSSLIPYLFCHSLKLFCIKLPLFKINVGFVSSLDTDCFPSSQAQRSNTMKTSHWKFSYT